VPELAARCGGPEGIITEGIVGLLAPRDDGGATAVRLKTLLDSPAVYYTSLKGNRYEDDEGLHCRAISGRDANGSRARADKSTALSLGGQSLIVMCNREDSPELNEAMGRRARATIEARFTEEVAGHAFLKVWDPLLKRADRR
jgi:hypothetical protein